jgi:putative hydroxymethylpyrimidine transporter CytX
LSSEAPQWGIDPVPERLRVLGLGDTLLLWGNLAVSLLVIVAGALLVPGLSLKQALLAIVVASVAGCIMLGAAAAVGTQARVPSMVLMRAPLGQRGSYLATALNVVQCLGWSVYELIIIASACAALSDRVFGFRAQWLWTILFGGVAVLLALMGPIGFVRRYVRKFAVWFVIASLGYLTWWVIDKSDLTAFWNAPGKGGFPTFWQGVDLTLASVISWTPLAADYTRFTRTQRSSFWGTSVGYLVPVVWLYSLGVLLFLARDISDPAQLPAAVVSGGVVAVIALLAVTVDESDEAFANVYSTAVSLQNVLPRVSQRLLIVSTAVIATAGALVLNLSDFATFLFLLGSFFVPLLGVLLADWFVDGRNYTRAKIFDGPAVRPEMIAAWLVGFGLYQWLSPQGPNWWQHVMGHTNPAPIDFTASLPSFAVAFLLAGLFALIARHRRPAEALAET